MTLLLALRQLLKEQAAELDETFETVTKRVAKHRLEEAKVDLLAAP